MPKEKDGWSISMLFLCNDFNVAFLVEYFSFAMQKLLYFGLTEQENKTRLTAYTMGA
jgi:hypothetical protein